MSKRIDLTGQKFNRLTVLGYSHMDKWKKTQWFCQCECGGQSIVGTSALKGGNTRSCGCLWREMMVLEEGESAFNDLYASYKHVAKKRNLIFLLSRDQFRKLTQQDCYYCGDAPSNKKTAHKSIFTYNGIDRVDNDRGYEPDNCVPSCILCNRAKSILSQAEFFQLITKIANKHIILKKEKV